MKQYLTKADRVAYVISHVLVAFGLVFAIAVFLFELFGH
jgi:hypothetical protein